MTGKANFAASVRARLLAVAKAEKVEFELMLTRFALERLLYRLSISKYREQFLLKCVFRRSRATVPAQARPSFRSMPGRW